MHESALFLIDMAAEGRGHTILTRALQLVLGTTKLLGDPSYSHLFPFEKRAQKSFFLHLSSFSLPRFDASSAHLVYSCLG